jgi:hypothetical protein
VNGNGGTCEGWIGPAVGVAGLGDRPVLGFGEGFGLGSFWLD